MRKINILFILLTLIGCSNVTNVYDRVFVKKEVFCPNLNTPYGTGELIVSSIEKDNNSYIGFRGIKKTCFLAHDEIEMKILVNLRSIRKNYLNDDLIPIKISLVSTDESDKEYDRDDLELRLFLKAGNRIVERESSMYVVIPKNGKSYIGIFKN